MKNTVISYMYRDGGNYKTSSQDYIFAGALTEEQIAAMMAHLHEGEYFIPKDVGLASYNGDDSEIDHCWHEFYAPEETERFQPTEEITIQEFFDKFMATKWQEIPIGKAGMKASIIQAIENKIQQQQQHNALVNAVIIVNPNYYEGYLDGMKAILTLVQQIN